VRSDGRRRVLVLINHGSDTQQVRLPAPMRSLLGAGAASDVVQLAPEDVAVLDARR
jgi:beta-galactosidase